MNIYSTMQHNLVQQNDTQLGEGRPQLYSPSHSTEYRVLICEAGMIVPR